MLVVEWGQDMKHTKALVGSEYDMAYFMLHFIPDVRQIISQLFCNECAKISAFVIVCGGGCRC
jgi:hypothetical protein